MNSPLPATVPQPPATQPGPPADIASPDHPGTARPWYRRTSLWAGAAMVVLLAAGAWYWQARQAGKAAPTYITQPVGRGNLTLTVTANGTLQPTRAINIGSELSGTVLKVNVDVNDRIRKGQVLVELDTAKLNGQILRARASVSAASARVAQSVATVREARASLARFEEVSQLSGGKVPSRAEMDGARAALARAVAEETSARAGVADAQAALATDGINLSKASIRAPSDGVILTRNVDPGNAVAASLQAVTLFSVAEDLSKLRLQVYVDEADVGSVKAGQPATFTVSAYAGRQYPATITRVAFGSTITDNVVTYLTHLDVNNSDLSLRPGMTASASIVAMRRTDVLLVPNSALRFEPVSSDAAAQPAASGGIVARLTPRMPRGARNSGSTAKDGPGAAARRVWVQRDGKAVPLSVTAGISDGRMTEVTAGELQAGMQVIVDQKTAAP
ncbi:MAG: efflux RND transporter periplasmic adaptor subunit [Ramlibacter sp.]|nr:efflux RND transporter periplasmic adaptor subunit [Ramlibacter sp.]